MHLMFSYADGRTIEAIVLSASVDRMRISAPDYEDVLELRNVEDLWILESGERVEIESIILAAGSNAIIPATRPRTRGARG